MMVGAGKRVDNSMGSFANQRLSTLLKQSAEVIDHTDESGLTNLLASTVGRVKALGTGVMLRPTDPLSLQRRIDPKEIEKLVSEFQAKYPGALDKTKVRIGGSDIKDEVHRAWNNEKRLPIIRHLQALGAGAAALAASANRADHYSPLTDTVTLYSSDPSIAAHELGHAVDLNNALKSKSLLGRMYARAEITDPLVFRIPLVPSALALNREYNASRNAIDVLRDRGPEAEDAAWSILAPAYGTYAGGGALALNHLLGNRIVGGRIPYWAYPVGGAVAGHGVAKLRNYLARKKREDAGKKSDK